MLGLEDWTRAYRQAKIQRLNKLMVDFSIFAMHHGRTFPGDEDFSLDGPYGVCIHFVLCNWLSMREDSRFVRSLLSPESANFDLCHLLHRATLWRECAVSFLLSSCERTLMHDADQIFRFLPSVAQRLDHHAACSQIAGKPGVEAAQRFGVLTTRLARDPVRRIDDGMLYRITRRGSRDFRSQDRCQRICGRGLRKSISIFQTYDDDSGLTVDHVAVRLIYDICAATCRNRGLIILMAITEEYGGMRQSPRR